jgi:hypothetical protein
VFDKNFIVSSIIDYDTNLKIFGNFATELTKSDVDVAVGFQYAVDETTTLKGKVNSRYVLGISLLKSYRNFVDFGLTVRMSTLNRKSNQFNPKFNFGISLNVNDI